MIPRFRPESTEELLARLRENHGERFRIEGSATKQGLIAPLSITATTLETTAFDRLIDFAPKDQTITVECGMSIVRLQTILAETGHCLPLPTSQHWLVDGCPGTVGGLLAMNLPHGNDQQFGNPKDWILQAQVIFNDDLARSGSKVVKSVAGFDLHKLIAGSRGQFGPILSATLRIYSQSAINESRIEIIQPWNGREFWILRTMPSEFQGCLNSEKHVLAVDYRSCTLWTGSEPSKPKEGWIIGPRGHIWRDTMNAELDQRAKGILDPNGRWA